METVEVMEQVLLSGILLNPDIYKEMLVYTQLFQDVVPFWNCYKSISNKKTD